MRALVIGAPGLVGGALLRSLTRLGAQMLGTYHSRPAPGFVPLELTDHEAVRRLVSEWRPSVIFVCAALTAVDYCEDHEDEARAINVRGPQNAAAAAAEMGASVVYYSTEYVFDGTHGPYGEDEPISPLGVYARSKADGEQAVRDTLDEHLIIRTTVVFGWDPGSMNFAMQVWKRLSVGEGMRVPVDQVGNPTLADFLAESSVKLVEGGHRGTINVVGRDRVPRTEFGWRLARQLGLEPKLIEPITTAELHQRAPRPLDAGLRTDKLAAILGSPAMSLDDEIAQFVSAKQLDLG